MLGNCLLVSPTFLSVFLKGKLILLSMDKGSLEFTKKDWHLDAMVTGLYVRLNFSLVSNEALKD